MRIKGTYSNQESLPWDALNDELVLDKKGKEEDFHALGDIQEVS